MKNNPYVGPRPYERADRDNFYGRNREGRDLLSLILAERVVLFYAQSGAGKTSLLNAKVIPDLEVEGFHVLPVVRVANDLPPGVDDADVDNVFIYSVLLALSGEDVDPRALCDQTLADALTALEAQTAQPDALTPALPLLIVDQFEELFTAHRHRWQDAEGFFRQIADALEALPMLGIVFAMREDYVAELDAYAHLVPRRFRARYRMERLGVEGALQAVREPAVKAGVPFDAGAAEHLVDDLRRRKVQRYGRGEEADVLGPFVEPVQLQVVCQRLWANLPEQEDHLIQWEEVRHYGDIDRALVDFYESALQATVDAVDVSERALRRWVAAHLITPMETRGLALRGAEETAGLPNAAVDVLDKRHFVRSDVRAGARWYELVHDRLIDPILQSNAEWEAAQETPLRATARRWAETQNDALLYRDSTLEEARRQAQAAPEILEPYERQFLEASYRAQQDRQRARRLRLVGAAVGALVLILVSILALLAMRNGLQAYSRELAAQSAALRETDRVRSIQVAYAGTSPRVGEWWRRTDQALFGDLDTASAQVELRNALQDFYPAEHYTRLPDQPHDLAYDVLGHRLYAALPGEGIWVNELRLDRIRYLSPPQVERGGAVRALDLSPDGRHLAAGGDNGQTGGVIGVWDAETARWTHALTVTTAEERYDEVYSVAFSPDGYYLAGGSDDDPNWRDYEGETGGLVRIWELGRRGDALLPTAVLTLTEPAGRVASLAFFKDHSPVEAWEFTEPYYLAAGAHDNLVWLWELEPTAPGVITVTRKISLTGHTGDVKAVAFSPTEPLLASASSDRTIRLWDLETARPRLTLIGHTAGVTSLSFSPDGRYLVSGGRDRTVRVWDIGARNPNAVTTLTGPESLVLSVSFDPDGATVAAGSGDLSVHIWDMNFSREMRLSTLTGHSAPARDVAFSPDGVFLASGDDRGETRIWSLRAGKTIVRMPTLEEKMWSLAYSPDGQYIATGFDDYTARIWDPATGALIATLREHRDDVEGLVFTPESDRLITVADDKQAVIWETEGWQKQRAFGIPAGLWDLTSDPAGKWLIGGYSRGLIYLWEMQRSDDASLSLIAPITLSTGTELPVVGLEVSADGRYLAAGSWDTNAYLWDLETLQPVAQPLEHPGYVYDVAFSPTGDYLATGSRDGVVRLWRLRNFPADPPELVGFYDGHTDLVWDVAFSPDGKYLLSSSWDGTIRRHLVPFEEVLELAKQYVDVNVNFDELSQPEGEPYD